MKSLFRKKCEAPFNDEALIRLSRTIETGLRSGRDWISVIRWISKNDPDEIVCEYFQGFLHRMSVDSTDVFLDQELKAFKSPLSHLFFQILKQNSRGNQNLSKLFQRFSKMAADVDQLQRRERGMLFVPRFQTWVAVGITLTFIVILPNVSGGTFPTFITLRRFDLFTLGISLMAIGFVTLQWMCVRVRRHFRPFLDLVFFLQFLSLFIESGIDLIGAWYRALELSRFNADTQIRLRRKDLSAETMDDFLGALSHSLKAPWPEIVTGILWAKTSGVGLSQYLQSTSERQSEILMSRWDDEIRRLSLTTIIPLGFLIFPSVLFLLVGPQFIQLVNS